MNLTDDQLIRIAKVIEAEPIFQVVFDSNLKGMVSDKDIMRHVIYYEDHGILYGYSGGKAKKTTMGDMYSQLMKTYGGRVAFKDDTGLNIEKVYGVPVITSKKKRTKKPVPTTTRKSKKKVPHVGGIPTYEPKVGTKKEFDGWYKNKRRYLSRHDKTMSTDGLLRENKTYRFPDGTEVRESEINGKIVNQHITRPIKEPYGFPFVTRGMFT